MTKNEIYHAERLALEKKLYGENYEQRTEAFLEAVKNSDTCIYEDYEVLEKAKEWLCEAHPFVIKLEHLILIQRRERIKKENAQYHH